MGYMKELDIRLRSGGDDAVAAFNEYVTIAGTVSADTGMGFIPANSFAGISDGYKMPLVPDGYKMRSIGWVSVSERLPEDGVAVLWFNKSWMWQLVVAKRNGESLDWGGDLSVTLHGFTHWMPLPEPPEVE